MLQLVVAVTVISATRDSFVDEIPTLYFAVASLHHALDPQIHRIDEGVVLFLSSLRNGLAYITLKLDVLDIDVAYEVATLEHEEATLHGGLIADLYLFPFCRERNIRIFAIAPVTQFAVELTCF